MKRLVIIGLVAGWLLLKTNKPGVETAPTVKSDDIVIAAAGDIACPTWYVKRDNECKETETAALARDADVILALGDLQYPSGAGWGGFDKSWGQMKDKIYPIPGNHEYNTPEAKNYFDYFGERAGKRGEGYYSFEAGKWHVVAVNSNCEFGTCDKDKQRKWLKKDLETNPAKCALVFMHHPRFASDERIGEYEHPMDSLWKIMAEGGVDVVLAGHHHVYERFRPTDGVREFVAGNGGRSLYSFGPAADNSEVRINDKFGVLKMTLRDGEYDWKFVGIDRGVYDQGQSECK